MIVALMLALAAAVTPSAVANAAADADLDALATTLGRAHALHRLCAGPSDDLWRGRMQAMLAAEHATPAQRGRLVTRFNAGFAEAAASYPVCSSPTRAALGATMARGRTQAAELARRDGDATTNGARR